MTAALPQVSRFVFGTGDIGINLANEKQERELVEFAIESRLWFHSAPFYGGWKGDGQFGTPMALKKIFKVNKKIAGLISKFSPAAPVEKFEERIKQNIEAYGVEKIDVLQVTWDHDISDDLANGGPASEAFRRCKEQGLIDKVILDVIPETSAAARHAAERGLFDGYIYYYCPVNINVDPALHAYLLRSKIPVLALRTLGKVYLKQKPGSDFKHAYIKAEHAAEVYALMQESGYASWLEFCMQFVMGSAGIHATIGSTLSMDHLKAYLRAAAAPVTMTDETRQKIFALIRKYPYQVK